jgi:hypothetical protein
MSITQYCPKWAFWVNYSFYGVSPCWIKGAIGGNGTFDILNINCVLYRKIAVSKGLENFSHLLGMETGSACHIKIV